MKKQFISAILLFSFFIMLSSCGNDLSRDKAVTLISEFHQFPEMEPTDISKVYVIKYWVEGYTSGGQRISGICRRFPMFAEKSAMLKDLQTKQLIQISERSVRQNNCNHIFADITLTDEGRQYLINETDLGFVLRAAEITLDEVTGIQANKDQNSVVADYTLKRINVTPFASDNLKTLNSGRAQLLLYDDGWRVN